MWPFFNLQEFSFTCLLWVIEDIMGQSYNMYRMQCLIKYDTRTQVRPIIHKTHMEKLNNTLVVEITNDT